MNLSKCCLDSLPAVQHHPCVVASVEDMVAIGIGSEKESCDRAAALALTITSALK